MRHSRYIIARLLAAAFTIVLIMPATGWAAVPPGVEPAEVTAHLWELPKTGGIFRADGSSPFDASGAYIPKPGDRLEVEYREGLKLSFFNVGEQGGEQYAEARIDYVREYLSAGMMTPKARPKEIGKAVPNADEPIDMVPARGILPPYSAPLYFMRFTGGPSGTFTQIGGRDRPDGPVTAQIVKEALDGQRYIELRPFYTRATLDDPKAFLGWPGEEPLAGDASSRSEEDSAVAADLIAYRGRVTFLYPDGSRVVLGDGSLDVPRDSLPIGTTVSTSVDSFLELRYSNGARYVLGPRSSVEFLQREATGVRLKRGRALVWHPASTTDVGSRTAMDFGVVAGDGAEWVVEEAANSSSVSVLSGEAVFSVPSSPESVELAAGQKVTATKKGPKQAQVIDVEALRAEWKELRRGAIKLESDSILTLPGAVPGITLAFVSVAAGMVLYARRLKIQMAERGAAEAATETGESS